MAINQHHIIIQGLNPLLVVDKMMKLQLQLQDNPINKYMGFYVDTLLHYGGIWGGL